LVVNVRGNDTPERVNPDPLTAAALTVSVALPVLVSVSVCAIPLLTASLPKLRLGALKLSVPAYAISDKAKLCELFEVDAVSVAVCAVGTAVAVAVKLALVAPPAI